MSAAYLPLRLDGESVGDLITVGQKVILFTVLPRLADLDGRTFDSPDAARDAAIAHMAPAALFRGLAA